MPWAIVSVIPHQPIERTRKCASVTLSQKPCPHIRKRWLVGTGWLRSALMQKATVDVHVARFRIATGQNRLAENRGCSNTVPPTHKEGSTEYARALQWKSGRYVRCTSSTWRPS